MKVEVALSDGVKGFTPSFCRMLRKAAGSRVNCANLRGSVTVKNIPLYIHTNNLRLITTVPCLRKKNILKSFNNTFTFLTSIWCSFLPTLHNQHSPWLYTKKTKCEKWKENLTCSVIINVNYHIIVMLGVWSHGGSHALVMMNAERRSLIKVFNSDWSCLHQHKNML